MTQPEPCTVIGPLTPEKGKKREKRRESDIDIESRDREL